MSEVEYTAKFIQSNECKRIGILSGAGISTNAGIPDYRSNNGLFNSINLDDPKLHLTQSQKTLIQNDPEFISNINLFIENPYPLYYQLNKFYKNIYNPTISHYFIKLLEDNNLLHRIYTQIIDGLHEKSGISSNKILNVHGSLSSFKCIKCNKISKNTKKYPIICNNNNCNGYIKPNVILFGEFIL